MIDWLVYLIFGISLFVAIISVGVHAAKPIDRLK